MRTVIAFCIIGFFALYNANIVMATQNNYLNTANQNQQTQVQSPSISIYINDYELPLTTAPVIENGTTLVPMRSIFEALGYKVVWDDKTKTAIGTRDDNTVIFTIDSNTAIVNSNKKNLLVAPKILNGSTMIPLRFLAESTGYTVDWNGAEKRIDITTDDIMFDTDLDEPVTTEEPDQNVQNDWDTTDLSKVVTITDNTGHTMTLTLQQWSDLFYKLTKLDGGSGLGADILQEKYGEFYYYWWETTHETEIKYEHDISKDKK